jgi:hypothetical protein
MADRVSVLGGDFTKTELPQDQDAVLMFNIIHGFDEAENQRLIGRAFGALAPGGKLFVLDQFREDARRSGLRSRGSLSQFIPLMVGLNLLNEIGGNAYTFEHIKRWCAEASAVKRVRLRLPGVTLVEIVK